MIDYAKELNPAQYEAATSLNGAVLVIAGAGSGKTRTIVYRLAHLVESGVEASSILLLTFTRRASQEMLDRARELLGQRGMGDLTPNGILGVQGGTFHGFAYSILRIFPPAGFSGAVCIMDSSDSTAALQHCRELLQSGKGDRSFPKNQTIMGIVSKSRNLEKAIWEIISQSSPHLLPHADDIAKMGEEYAKFKRAHNLLDYDDLLFELEAALRCNADALNYCRRRYKYIMIDEYQDTNRVQARLAGLLAGFGDHTKPGASSTISSNASAEDPPGATPGSGNIMVVGDDAQSIYAFRGANVRNILDLPDIFPDTKVIRLEENYRSTQPLLDLDNSILDNATEGFRKHLFTQREGKKKPQVIRPISDLSQAALVAARIAEFSKHFPPEEIAVLFRAGYQSYNLEVQLNKMGIRFKKYGGIRYTDAAHVKDAISFVRLVLNPLDFTAFQRVCDLVPGVGSKTCLKIYQSLQNIQSGTDKTLEKALAKFPTLKSHFDFIDEMRRMGYAPEQLLIRVTEHYTPLLEANYPDDYPRRMQGLDELVQIASGYGEIDLFITDLCLEDPRNKEENQDAITLSTIHSAKGLEWGAVLIMDLVEERFPSRHAMARQEEYEEERRLMYVACTRAKEQLCLFVPSTLYERGAGGSGGRIPAAPSPFVREIPSELYDEWQESMSGGLVMKEKFNPESHHSTLKSTTHGYATADNTGTSAYASYQKPRTVKAASSVADPKNTPMPSVNSPQKYGYCNHKIFGRGKIIKFIAPDKYQINFPGLGLKVIMASFVQLEEE